MAIRNERFVETDRNAIRIEDISVVQRKAFSHALGFGTVLYKTEDEAMQWLVDERKSNDLLNEAWKTASLKLQSCTFKKDDKLAGLSINCQTAALAYTQEKPDLYRYFNADSRGLKNFFEWENFQYKGFWLLLHKAVTSSAATYDDLFFVYRGCNLEFSVQVGSKIMFQQFTSTTRHRKIAEEFLGKNLKSIFILDVSIALGLRSISAFPNEDEYLIAPNHGYTVTDVKEKDGVKEIYLKSLEMSFVV